MYLLELFAGSRSVGKAAEQLNMQVFSTDIVAFENIDLVEDIRKVTPKDIPFLPDIIWASPLCTAFSVASMWRHWKKIGGSYVPQTEKAFEGMELVRCTLLLIRKFQKLNPALIWYLENPRGMLRKMPFMAELPFRHTVSYCQYGDTRMKPTDIWTNNDCWNPRTMCRPGGTCHVASPRGSKTGTQALASSFERAKIPHHLCIEVLEAAQFKCSQRADIA